MKVKFCKNLAGFTFLELLFALFVSSSVIVFTVSGVSHYSHEMEWKNTLYSFEKNMILWQAKALQAHEKIKIDFIPNQNCLNAHFLSGEEVGNFILPKEVNFTKSSHYSLQYNEYGNFSYLFRLHFSHDTLRKQQNYSLVIGGRL